MTLHIFTPHKCMIYNKIQPCCMYVVFHRLAITYYGHPMEYSEKLLYHWALSFRQINFEEKKKSIMVFPLGRNAKVACLRYFRSESKYFILKKFKK